MSDEHTTDDPLTVGVLRPTFFWFGAASRPTHRKNLDQKVPRDSVVGLARGTDRVMEVAQ
ncbi:hypothetical protein SAMN04488691_106207 [Haloferax larsenii]|uniref:Uncharacterized protein n=1 Tax=Haloferax larsenii TaxID=302484 RepID=A0A1H7RX43_HALLR|nr:hypothetical protein SAMN04488691_106207 [Haloferax larsenii]